MHIVYLGEERNRRTESSISEAVDKYTAVENRIIALSYLGIGTTIQAIQSFLIGAKQTVMDLDVDVLTDADIIVQKRNEIVQTISMVQ